MNVRPVLSQECVIARSPAIFNKLEQLCSEGKLNDLFCADLTLNCANIFPEILKCMRTFQLTFQDMETCLRLYKCHTTLVAESREATEAQYNIVDTDGKQEKKYFLYVSCNRREEWWHNRFKNDPLYLANFQKLVETGVLQKRDPA